METIRDEPSKLETIFYLIDAEEAQYRLSTAVGEGAI